MPTITSIEKQKKTGRVNVFIDGRFSFGTSLEAVLRHGVRKDKEIDEETIGKLKEESNLEKVYGRLLRFSTIRPRSEKEIKLWFKRKNIDPSLGAEVFNKLKNVGLVDDGAFAKWWIEQRREFRPRSKMALTSELKQKGIAREIIDEVLQEINTSSELEFAKRVALKKLRALSGLPFGEKKRKLFGFLGRRGFSWETANKSIDELLKRE